MDKVDEVLGPSSPLARRLEGYEHREGQLAMARAVERTLGKGGHLFVEAGTGTGKTLAYLVPAILSGKKVVVSTATHALEEQIFGKDIPLVRDVLREHGITFRAALMKGLSNYVCKRRFEERLASGEPLGAELVRIERWARATKTGDRGEIAFGADAFRDVHSSTETRIGAGCKYYEECFVTQMRREADQAEVVVVNHHLFFADLALRTARSGFGSAIPAYDAVIFDEAHQIESIATDFFGARLSHARLQSLVRDARKASGTIARLTEDVDRAGDAFFRAWRMQSEGRRLLLPSEWTSGRRDATGRLDASLHALATAARVVDEEVAVDALSVIARRASEAREDLARIWASADDRHFEDDEGEMARAVRGFAGGVVWVDEKALGASPIDLAPILREKLWDRVDSVVCTSATLATGTPPSFHFAKGRLGATPEAEELVVASPFDFAKRAALYVPGDMVEAGDPSFDLACADRVAELVAVTGGGAFVLCTSNRAMRRIHAALVGRVPGALLLQGEAPKQALLERFRVPEEGDRCAATLVATMSFWEGVDVPGHALRLVVLDKIPFAVPSDPIVMARSARIEVEGGNPFMQYSVPAAAITLKQGFGRLIRSRRDAGLVALLDKRAARKGYGKRLLDSLPPARRLATLDEVREFWWALDE